VRQFLRRIFLENISLKLVSLVLAITVFVLVRGEKDAQSGGFVKVIYRYPSGKVLMTDPPNQVRLSVRGPWTRVTRFDVRDLDPIRVDLGAGVSGEFKFQDDMVKLPPGLRVASFNPASVRLDFEPRVHRTVPVSPALDGNPAPGYRLEATDLDPSAVSVSGAQSVVTALQHVSTDLVGITGAHGTVTRTVALAGLPRHAEYVDEAKVKVTVRIVAEMGERVFNKVAVQTVGGAASVRFEPPAVDVVVRGPRPTLDALAADAVVASVDVNDLPNIPHGGLMRRVSVGGLAEGLAGDARPASVRIVPAKRAP
jgi:YbbR domain-containing protein